MSIGTALLLWAPSPASAAKTRRSGKAAPAPAEAARAKTLLDEGYASLKKKSFSTAITAFQRAAEADPGSAEAFFQLGNAYFQRGFSRGTPDKADAPDVKRAVEAFETALAIDPNLTGLSEPFLLHHGLGQCYEAMGRYDEAAEQMRKGSLAAPHNPMPPLYSAGVRYKMRDLKQSAQNLFESVQRARRIRSYPSLARLVRTHPQFAGLLQVPQNKMILEAYDQVEAGTLNEAQARSQIDERLSLRDALGSSKLMADESRVRIVAAPAPDPRLHDLVADADGDFKFRKHRRAILEYEEALRLDGSRGSLGTAEKARIMQNIGVSFRMLGLTEQAIAALERSSQEMPRVSGTYYQLALAYSTAGQFTSALHALDLALQNAHSTSDLRMTLLLSKTDTELEPIRDMPGYQRLVSQYASKSRASLK